MAVRELSDAELIAGARKGDSEAFGELYRRHVDSARAAARALTRSHSDADDLTSEAFARVLRALQGGGGPEVSFRPYLVTAVRNVFYDKVRRNREEPSADMSDEVNVTLLEAANNQEDGAFASAAFATLPERWQLVLWHTEVEGRSVAEVAPLLGLAPNAVAALAYRAREGLRQAYLQAHLHDQQAAECRECSASLGAYVRDGLSARDRRRIDAHLDECESCTALVAELTDTNNTLRAALIPALVGVSATAYLSGLGGNGLLAWVSRVPKKQQAVAGATVAASIIAVAAFAGLFGGRDEPPLSAPTSSVVTQVVPATDDSVSTKDSVPTSTSTRPTAPPSATSTVTTTVTTTATTMPPVTVPPTFAPPPAPPTTVRRPPATTPRSTTPVTNPPVTNPPVTNPPVTTTPPTTPTTQPPVPSSLTVASRQQSAALAGGNFLIEMTVTNTGSSAVNGIQLDVPDPVGATLLHAEALGAATPSTATFVSAAGAGWSCAGNVSCTLPALPPGQSAVLQLTFAVAPSAAGNITFSPSIAAPAGATVSSPPITVPVAVVPDLLAADTEHGALRAIGNTVVACDDLGPDCVDARAGTATGTAQDHNAHAMQYVQTAGGAINSSSADLSVVGSVSKAYLTWSGDLDQGGSAPSPADFDKVTFTTPTGTTVVTADRTENFDAEVPGNPGMYAAYADVTALVSGSGTYSVADVQTALGTASFGGWSLVVIDRDASLPLRFMMITSPFKVVRGTPAATSLSFGVDLPQAMVDATGLLVAPGFEGDRSLELEEMSLSGFTTNNPFQGKIDGPRDTAFQNSLGTDVVAMATAGMNGSRLEFNAKSENDRVILPLVGVALDL